MQPTQKDRKQCFAYTLAGGQCKNRPIKGKLLCQNHVRQWGLSVIDQDVIQKISHDFKISMRRKQRWEKRHPGQDFPELLPVKTIILICGAKTRSGTLCKRQDIFANGRCRLHGGLSTGPRTEAGKKRSALNGKKPRTP